MAAAQNPAQARRVFVRFLVLVAAACAGLLSISALRGGSPALIVSDGKQYYAWARSALLDGDLDFRNDYLRLYPPDPLPPEYAQQTRSGRVVNKYPVGLALLELPGLLLGHAVATLAPGVPADGVSAPYQFAVAFSLAALSIGGAFLLFAAALRLGADPWSAFGAAAAMILATNLIHYTAKEPAMTHGAGAALAALALFVTSGWGTTWDAVRLRERIALGACCGLLLLVRNTNVVLAPALAVFAFRGRPLALRPLAPVLAAALAVAALQPLAFSALWGELRWFSHGTERFSSGPGGVVLALFSPRHGLFLYHPWYAVLLGLAAGTALSRDLRALGAGALASFAAIAAVNGTWWCWWFGDSFGHRGFIEILPVLSLVAALALSGERAPRPLRVAVAAAAALAAVLNLILWAGYLLQRFPHDGRHSVAAAYLWFL